MSTTRNTRYIQSSPGSIFAAFSDPQSIAAWMAPADMQAKVHHFDFREGGGYEMSLFYPDSEMATIGKSGEHEDRYVARYLELIPAKRITMSIRFSSNDAKFSGEMVLEVDLIEKGSGTEVIFTFKNIPAGIRPEDNEAGTESTLDKLAAFVSSRE